jgi:protoporphyrinogen oxidase
MKVYDIIIIGAGIAGLYTGIQLLKKYPHYNIIILEKYKYIGGRVVSYSKDISDIGTVSWENGAGRIHSSHKIVQGLLKQYDIKTVPISDDIQYISNSGNDDAYFEDFIHVYLQPLKSLPLSVLQENTLYSICKDIYGIKETQRIFERFPYYTEVHVLRADIALEQFTNEMGTRNNYYICKNGLSELIEAMTGDFTSRGGIIQEGSEVISIKKNKNLIVHIKNNETLYCKKVICTVPVASIRKINVFSNWAPIDRLKMMPLLRIYMVFPKSKGGMWFKNIPKTVTSNKLRYIIPINAAKGTIMVSYTDGVYTKEWMKYVTAKEYEKLSEKLLSELRSLFPDCEIPVPVFMKAHPWYDGTTAWLPGKYDIKKVYNDILKGPIDDVYVCGESYSFRQAWMEGALESAQDVLKII